eukprot:13904758-Alexandrium_andersonii.AAC.1
MQTLSAPRIGRLEADVAGDWRTRVFKPYGLQANDQYQGMDGGRSLAEVLRSWGVQGPTMP